jgi:asparagine synthase (glutamine-hydrolysing)
VPLSRWFRGELAGFARDLLLSDTCRQRGIFNVGYIERLLKMNAQGRDLDLQLWTVLSLEMWCRRFLDVSPQRATEPRRHGVKTAPGLGASVSPWPVAVKGAAN